MKIRPAMRVIEVGNIVYSPALQRTPLATEAQYLLARYVFETLGNRRYRFLLKSRRRSSSIQRVIVRVDIHRQRIGQPRHRMWWLQHLSRIHGMEIRVVVSQFFRQGQQHFFDSFAAGIIRGEIRQFHKTRIQLFQGAGKNFQRLAIQRHIGSRFPLVLLSRSCHSQRSGEFALSARYCKTLSICPAVFNKSSCACCRWNVASSSAIHFSFSSRRAFSTTCKPTFPSSNRACSCAKSCWTSCNSRRATSLPASVSRTCRVIRRTSALTWPCLLDKAALAASRFDCASATFALMLGLKIGTCA